HPGGGWDGGDGARMKARVDDPTLGGRYPEVREFRIVLTQVWAIDEITVEIEVNAGVDAGVAEGLVPRLAADLADAHEGLRFNVELVREGPLPIFELKARRLVDRRGEK